MRDSDSKPQKTPKADGSHHPSGKQSSQSRQSVSHPVYGYHRLVAGALAASITTSPSCGSRRNWSDNEQDVIDLAIQM
ncbi:hypothetical protein ACLOJK_002963 [Asimina triloba]